MTEFTDAFFPNVPSENEAPAETEEQKQETETEQVTEPVEEPTETAPIEAPEHPDKGKFTKDQERPAIPVEALLEERTKRQEAERKHQELQQKLAELEKSKAAEARPDPFDNPDGYDAYQEQRVQALVQAQVQQLQQQQLANWINQSGAKAEAAGHSKDSITGALQWAGGQDANFKAQLHQQADPVSWIFEQQNRYAQVEEFMRDPDSFKAKLISEQSTAPANTGQNKTTTAGKTASTKSVASMGSGNVQSPVSNESDTEFLKGVFSRRS